jgi:hypothetical protein
MSQYREKFLEAEEKASQLIIQLEELKKSSNQYRTASESLDKTREEIGPFITSLTSIVKEASGLIQTLKEIDTGRIISEVNNVQSRIKEITKSQSTQFSKLIKLSYIVIGILIVIGFIVVFK